MRIPVLAPLHREGWVFVAIFLACALMLGLVSDTLGWIGIILTGWCVYFFRDPERVTPVRSGLVVSPADGVIQAITLANPPQELDLKGEDWTRISIFLSVFDVHVNRIPCDGKIIKSVYRPGKFINASLDKASEYNERQALAMVDSDGHEIAFVQIAGLIARRILCDVQEGQQVRAGERFGMIRFGSRVDIYLPKNITPLVIEGQRVIGGETVIADFSSQEPERIGEVR
ncbi:MAG: phosphatidylserine decarboxylase [Caedimonas sp.]|nr:phosphatidylserine decarboxylase [Caedimonas sp.]